MQNGASAAPDNPLVTPIASSLYMLIACCMPVGGKSSDVES